MNINDFLNVATRSCSETAAPIKIESINALARLFVQVFSLWDKQAGLRDYY